MRTSFAVFVFAALASLAAAAPRLAGPPRQKQPAWWRQDGVVVAGSWESVSYRIRAGGDAARYQDELAREQSEETARRLKDMGFTLLMVPLYKGFGLKAERPQMESTKRFTEICHRLGLRVGVYTFSGTIGYESLLAEEPGALEWLQRDADGKFTTYGDRYYRRWVNRAHPGVRAHMKELVRYAVEEAKVDLIHFDNYVTGPAYDQYSVRQFREYVARRYTPDQRLQRFGFSVVDYLEPPPRPATADRYNSDALYRDFIDFRCEVMADTYRELSEYARSLNPDIVMELNAGGYHGELARDLLRLGSVDHTRMFGHGGAFWDEGYPSRLENGVVFSRFRSHKMGRQFGNMVFHYTPEPVAMAESMANNMQCIGNPIWWQGGEVIPFVTARPGKLSEKTQQYIRFFRANQDLYRDAEEVADIGVLGTYANTAYGPALSRRKQMAFEQTLYQGKTAFALVPGRYPGDLSRFRALVLADLELMPAGLLEAVSEYVRAGGGLVLTGQAAARDEEGRSRERDLVAGLTGRGRGSSPLRSPAGKGRLSYLPEVVLGEAPETTGPEGRRVLDAYVLPLNRAKLLEEVRWAAGQPPAVEVEAPETVTMALYRQPSGRHVLHLVNYDESRTVADIRVTLRLGPDGGASAVLRTPDGGRETALPVARKGAALTFTVPSLETYAVIAVK